MAQFVCSEPTARALDYGRAGFAIWVTRAANKVARPAHEGLDEVHNKIIAGCVVAVREEIVLLRSRLP